MNVLTDEQALAELSIDYLRGASTLGALSEQAILLLLKKGVLLQLEQGEHLYKYGERGDSFFVILKGSVSHFKLHHGKRAYIRDYSYGEELGSVTMIGLQLRKGEAIANEPTLALQVSSDLFFELQLSLPTDFSLLLLNITREMTRRLIELTDQLVDLNKST